MRRLISLGMLALFSAQSVSAGPPSFVVTCPARGSLHEGFGDLNGLAIPSPEMRSPVGPLPFVPRHPFCHLQTPRPMEVQSVPDMEPGCGLAGMTRDERREACATPHRSAESAQKEMKAKTRQPKIQPAKQEEIDELRRRLDQNEKNVKLQTEILEEIRKAMQCRPQGDANSVSTESSTKGIERAGYATREEASPKSNDKDQPEPCSVEYVHFRHAARIVADRPDVSPFEALIYEGMYLELFDDGTFRLHYIIETPNTDVVMRLQFVVAVADQKGEYAIEATPWTITLPPIRFSRQRDRQAGEERVFWTVGQVGFSPYLALGTRHSECQPRILIRRAEAEFGSVPDRPVY